MELRTILSADIDIFDFFSYHHHNFIVKLKPIPADKPIFSLPFSNLNAAPTMLISKLYLGEFPA